MLKSFSLFFPFKYYVDTKNSTQYIQSTSTVAIWILNKQFGKSVLYCPSGSLFSLFLCDITVSPTQTIRFIYTNELNKHLRC